MRRRLPIAFMIVGGVVAVLLFTSWQTPVPDRVHPDNYPEKPAHSAPPESPAPRSEPVPELVTEANRGDIAARAQLCSEAMARGEKLDDYQDAADWCFLAAQDGDARSQANYARLLQLGAGVAQDEVEAVTWYEKAVAQQDPHAMYMRGRMLLASNDAADNARGRALMESAAALGDANARWALRDLGDSSEGNQQPSRTLIR